MLISRIGLRTSTSVVTGVRLLTSHCRHSSACGGACGQVRFHRKLRVSSQYVLPKVRGRTRNCCFPSCHLGSSLATMLAMGRAGSKIAGRYALQLLIDAGLWCACMWDSLPSGQRRLAKEPQTSC